MNKNMKTKLTTPEVIADSQKAKIALRTYGVSLKKCEEILAVESEIASGILTPQFAISPALIELFGEQFISESMEYAYLFMDEYDLEWCDYELILKTLLKVFLPEELMFSPEKIRQFIKNIRRKVYYKLASGDIDNFHTALIAILDDIGDYDGIKELCEDPDIYDEMAPAREEIEED